MRARPSRSRVLWVAALAWLAGIGPSAGAATIDWVAVDAAGNAADTTGFGSVAIPYRISRFEITNAQYAEFLNAVAASDPNGLYNKSMGLGAPAPILRSPFNGPEPFSYIVGAGKENQPVNFVSYLDAARFANWLHNGQPTGMQDPTTTEDGAYTLPASSFTAFSRNPGATVFLPSEDEWYKAAYYDPSTSSYFKSPLSTNANPICAPPGPGPNMANCSGLAGGHTDVGAYTGSPSPFGTFDQGGNVAEWTEGISSGSNRVTRGGHSGDFAIRLFSNSRIRSAQRTEKFDIGFRVATGPAPGTPDQEFFMIDPTQSFVEIRSTSVLRLEFMGAVMAVDLPLQSQVGAGGTATLSDGLRTSLTGYLLVDIPVGGGALEIEIINRRSSVLLVDSGSWLPGLPGSPATSAPAALAANLGSTAYALSISAAVRGAEFSVGHSGIPEPLTDLGDGHFSFPLGYMSNAFAAKPVDGVVDVEDLVGVPGMSGGGRASLSLSPADAPSLQGVVGTLLEQPSGGRQITLPLDGSLVLTDDTFAAGLPISLRLDLTGRIVAATPRFVPEPVAPLAWLASLGTLAVLRRTRRS